MWHQAAWFERLSQYLPYNRLSNPNSTPSLFIEIQYTNMDRHNTIQRSKSSQTHIEIHQRHTWNGLILNKRGSQNLYGFSDVDWVGCPNTTSTSEIIYIPKRKLHIVELTKANHNGVMSWTHLDYVLTKGCQNSTAKSSTTPIHMVKNPFFHTIHRNFVARGHLITKFVSSTNHVVVIFTKALPKANFKDLRSKLGAYKIPTGKMQFWDCYLQTVKTKWQ